MKISGRGDTAEKARTRLRRLRQAQTEEMYLVRRSGLVIPKPAKFNVDVRRRDQVEKKSGPVGDLKETVKALRTSAPVELADLMAIWRSHDPKAWPSSPEIYQLLGERILKQGAPLLAYDIISEGLKNCPIDVRLRQLQGLALARSGATERASRILEQLREENHVDEETLGMLARTYKDRAARTATSRDARKFLRRAAEIYMQAHDLKGGYWTGINAATTALLIGNKERATKLAKDVRASCLRQLERTRGDKYWLLATLGETALVLRDWSQAKNWYAQAGQIGRRRFGDLQSSRRNARLLFDYWKADPSEIERCLQIPRVALFAGHMIDQPGRARPRFPAELEPAVAQAIRRKIEAADAGIGYSSAACGSDILFLEAMLDSGGEIIVVLPYEREQFIRDSVDLIQGSRWSARFERVLERATRVVTASRQRLEIGDVSYDYTNQLLLGLARIHAGQLETGLAPLAVWDRSPGDGAGGTATAIERWREIGLPVEIIDLVRLLKEAGIRFRAEKTKTRKRSKPKPRRAKPARNRFRSRIMSMLFADAVAFSKLTEEEVPRFVQHFLGSIGRLIARSPREIVAKNTWGDGLYLVFSNVEAAGKFALDLCDLITRTRWEMCGLPGGLGLRIALHAGPVYEFNDPITGGRTYSGTHVSRAARIEPITPPGQVYASEAFAALAAAQRATSFDLDYAGQIPMTKSYGTFPIYHVRRM
jgi:class 3 adenylate cyclase/tetratricopeptide (TPR) repeat protein